MNELPSTEQCDEPTFTELDFIADLLYQRHAREVQKYATGVRWWCHRPDGDNGRGHWRREAAEAFLEWAKSERETKEKQYAKTYTRKAYSDPKGGPEYDAP
jgi:hypothetical protein